jgi:pyruvate,water dikinase
VFRLVGADSSRHPVVELVAGRVYFNANVGLAALKPFVVIVQRIPKFAEALGGARINGDPQTLLKVMSVPDLGFRWLKYLLSWPRLLPLILAHSPRRGEAWIKRVKARNDQLTRTSFEAMATAELERFFSRAVRESFEGWDLLYLGTQAIALPLFDRLCRTWLNDPDLAVGYRLFGGLGGIPEAEAGVALWNLSTLAHSDPYIERLIRSAPSWDQAQRQLERTQPGRKLLKAWAAFMTEHGHHCRSELELANPRWAETPDYILSVVRSYLDAIGQCSPPEAQARLAAQRRQLTADCTQRLADPLRQWIFSQTLARTQKAAVAREIWKNEVVRVMAFLRRVLLLLGARLHADGSLADPQDIFFLTASELEPVCAGNLAADYRTLIQKRRREYSRNQQLHPPPLVVDHFDAEAQGSESPAPDGNVLTGIPVSPGMVAGPARVILRNSHHEQVLPGEILVAPFTDPAWTPYFVPAAALVTDLGGILSHGSIVAREYGIPAVTNVGCATRAIATGDWVEVDGTRGRVTILKRLRPT